MATDYNYDVFISYSRKDYVDEATKEKIPNNVISIIKKSFDDNGITYWMDEEGNLTGKKFAHIIAGKIRESMVFLFVCSKNSVASKWVDRELSVADTFDKHIIPFICDDSYKDDKVVMFTAALDRVEFWGKHNKDNEIAKLVKSVKKDKEELEEKRKREDEILKQKEKEEEERRKREEQEKKKKEAVNEIKKLATDYRMLSLQQDTIVQQLHEKNLIIGKETKECPVCKATSPIETTFCGRCGFQFPQLYAIDGNESYPFDNRLLATAKTNYEAVAFAEKEKEKMEKECQQLKATFSEKEEDCQKQLKDIATMDTELNNLRDSISLLQVEIDQKARENENIKSKNNALETQYRELEEWKKLIDEKTRKEEQIKAEEKSNAEKKRLAEEKRREQEALASERVFTLGSVSFKMIRVEGGDMGTFYIGETQVTQALWQAVMGNNNNQSSFEGQEHPVLRVSWNDICGKDGSGTDSDCFLNKLNYKLNLKTAKKFRLPKEAEWEYAAKGGNRSKGYTYAGSEYIEKVAWYNGNSMNSTHPVKELSPNELGIYDMSGNVWEWCEDLYKSSGDRVLRGGGWGDFARFCCVSSRDYSKPDDWDDDIGFRLVLPQ